MKNNTATLTTAQVLTITSDILLCTIDDLHQALSALTGSEDLMTHQLVRAADSVVDYVHNSNPWVDDVELPDFEPGDEEAINQFISDVSIKYGHTHKVSVPENAYTHMDPLVELIEMRGGYDD